MVRRRNLEGKFCECCFLFKMEIFIVSSIHECIVLYEDIHTLSPWEIIKQDY